VVGSVRLPYSQEVLTGARIEALSSNLQYAAIVINNDTLVIQDLVDTSRSLLDECVDCGLLSIDFSSKNRELVVLGTNNGGIWDLDSMRRAFYDPLLTTRNPYAFVKFGFANSGDLLLNPSSKKVTIYDRGTKTIRASRTFTNSVYNAEVIDDHTVICEIKDSLLILDSSLSTISSVAVFPQLGSSPIAWNAENQLIALQLYQNDILLLKYGIVTSVHDFENHDENPSPKAFYGSFAVTIPSFNTNAIRVYNVSGIDVTDVGVTYVSGVNETSVVSHQLPAGLYTIVDRSTGWATVVMLLNL
jgi:hypothetical protein